MQFQPLANQRGPRQAHNQGGVKIRQFRPIRTSNVAMVARTERGQAKQQSGRKGKWAGMIANRMTLNVDIQRGLVLRYV